MKKYDFLIIGSGIAGLTVALKAAATYSVAIITKASQLDGSTNMAQGGIASVMLPDDSFESHIADTITSGAGLCNPSRVKILAEQGPSAIQQLIDWGVAFTQNSSSNKQASQYHLALEGGHSKHRILHSNDLTGQEIMRALIEEVQRHENIDFFENHTAIDLILSEGTQKQCIGVEVLNNTTLKESTIYSRATFIATGGAAQIFKHSTNPSVSTGDGISMAFRAGNSVEDMEFMQFHPTSLYNPGEKTFLISEALRGHGAILKNHLGEEFMKGVHPLQSLAPRNIVAKAIDREMKKHHTPHVYLDITHKSEKDLKKHFPNIFKKCEEIGLNMSRDWIPVVPAAHYLCGGVKANSNAQTTTKGLYICGEAACFETHGANRLASNSLLESVVFSLRSYEHCIRNLPDITIPERTKSKRVYIPETQDYSFFKTQVQNLMWDKVGIVRNNENLTCALELIRAIREKAENDFNSPARIPVNLIELRNIALCAELVITSALRRKESRGLHYSDDYPEAQSDKKARHILIHTHQIFKDL